MEVILKNEGGLSANNSVSIAAKMTNDEKEILEKWQKVKSMLEILSKI